MRIRNERDAAPEKLEMTAMIDIVFLLLVFFVMTFQVSAMEGDFSIAPAPPPAEEAPQVTETLPLQIRLTAAADGSLAAVALGESKLADLEDLHQRIRQMHAADPAALRETEAIIAADARLKYQHVIAAITAVSGYKDANGNIVKMIQKIKFAAPQP